VAHGYYSGDLQCTTRQGGSVSLYSANSSFLDMVESCAEHFPPDIYGPLASVPSSTSNLQTAPAIDRTPSTGPALNLRAGGYELSVGGAAGSGLYRSSQADVGASFQIPQGAAQVAEGLRDGAGRLWGNVRQQVADRVSRTGTPQG
jgi:hypothetical protein